MAVASENSLKLAFEEIQLFIEPKNDDKKHRHVKQFIRMCLAMSNTKPFFEGRSTRILLTCQIASSNENRLLNLSSDSTVIISSRLLNSKICEALKENIRVGGEAFLLDSNLEMKAEAKYPKTNNKIRIELKNPFNI